MWLKVTEILRVKIELNYVQGVFNKFWKQTNRDIDVCVDVISNGGRVQYNAKRISR